MKDEPIRPVIGGTYLTSDDEVIRILGYNDAHCIYTYAKVRKNGGLYKGRHHGAHGKAFTCIRRLDPVPLSHEDKEKEWTLAPGRVILRNGKPFVMVNKSDNLSPVEADRFAAKLVRMLNVGAEYEKE